MSSYRMSDEQPIRNVQSLAITESSDDPDLRQKYRPFLLKEELSSSDWIAKLELSTVMNMVSQDMQSQGNRLKVLVLFGSLRERYDINPKLMPSV